MYKQLPLAQSRISEVIIRDRTIGGSLSGDQKFWEERYREELAIATSGLAH
jgi:hypothetical protein